MKRIILLALILILTACGNEATITTLPDPSPDQIMKTSKGGLSLMLDEDTFTGSPTVINTTFRNDSLSDVDYGEFYHVEVKKDDQWYMITYSDSIFIKNPHFNDFGSILPAGVEVHQSFSVQALGVTLIPGDYRLVKSFSSNKEQSFKQSVACPFWVK